MKRKHIEGLILSLNPNIEELALYSKGDLRKILVHEAAHLTVEVEHLRAKRDHWAKISEDLMGIILRHPEARKDLAASIRNL